MFSKEAAVHAAYSPLFEAACAEMEKEALSYELLERARDKARAQQKMFTSARKRVPMFSVDEDIFAAAAERRGNQQRLFNAGMSEKLMGVKPGTDPTISLLRKPIHIHNPPMDARGMRAARLLVKNLG